MFLVVFFFFFLLVSLFLGDGKQPFVDVWWALGILIMYGFRYYQRGKLDLRPLPRLVGFVWITLILYYVILTPFSDSAGYSISATVRLVEGYLVYVFFSGLSRDSRNQNLSDSGNQAVELFTTGLLLVGVVATIASFVFLLNPSLARFLPSMNLLFANYGHNHLAGLLLFVFPVTIGLVEKKKNIWAIGALGLFIVGMVLTFARGAWILLVLYFVSLFVMNKNTFIKRVSLFVAMVIVVVFLGTALLSARGEKQNSIYFRQLNAFIFKPSVPSDNRLEYWRQAIEAIKERPLFGSGPGTFYLLSRRLQSAPNSWSWFAHSFPLQTAAETGLVGLSIFLFLICVLFRGSWVPDEGQKNDQSRRLLLWGVLLVFFYGMYEFAFDFVSIWILLCALMGSLTLHNTGGHDKQRTSIAVTIFLSILTVFYFLSLGSVAASALNNKSLVFVLAPYNIDALKDHPDKYQDSWLAALSMKSLRYFHKTHPDALSLVAAMESDALRRQDARESLAVADPWGPAAFEAVDYLVTNKLWERAAAVIVAKQGHEADLVQRRGLASRMLDLGDGLYKDGKLHDAGLWYKRAQEEDAWALDRHEPALLRVQVPARDALVFLDATTPIPGFYLGKYRDAYVAVWKKALFDAVRLGDYEGLVHHVRGIASLSSWIKNDLWRQVGGLLVRQGEKDQKDGNEDRALEKAQIIVKLYYELAGQQQDLDFPLRERTSEWLMRLGNTLVLGDLVVTEKLQEAALDMVPWISKRVRPWFEEIKTKNLKTEILSGYLDHSESAGRPWEEKSRTHAAFLLVDRLIREGNPEDVYRYAKRITAPEVVNYLDRKLLVARLQQRADTLLLAHNATNAEFLVLSMKFVLPEDYWASAQAGYFYLAVGNKQKAEGAFTSCLEARSGGHKDCTFGLRAVTSDTNVSSRYEQISRIIQGNAEWTEF